MHFMTPAQKAAHNQAIKDKQKAARTALPEKERKIFEFIQSRWDALGADFDSHLHEQPVLREAAQEFGVTVEEAKSIFVKVEGAGLGL
jgi:uncharacterized tellurite resistance protein B-like protein